MARISPGCSLARKKGPHFRRVSLSALKRLTAGFDLGMLRWVFGAAEVRGNRDSQLCSSICCPAGQGQGPRASLVERPRGQVLLCPYWLLLLRLHCRSLAASPISLLPRLDGFVENGGNPHNGWSLFFGSPLSQPQKSYRQKKTHPNTLNDERGRPRNVEFKGRIFSARETERERERQTKS